MGRSMTINKQNITPIIDETIFSFTVMLYGVAAIYAFNFKTSLIKKERFHYDERVTYIILLLEVREFHIKKHVTFSFATNSHC